MKVVLISVICLFSSCNTSPSIDKEVRCWQEFIDMLLKGKLKGLESHSIDLNESDFFSNSSTSLDLKKKEMIEMGKLLLGKPHYVSHFNSEYYIIHVDLYDEHIGFRFRKDKHKCLFVSFLRSK